jgi:hypothetical protein
MNTPGPDKTRIAAALLSQPVETRDEDWLARFYVVIPDARLVGLARSPVHGPDGFPYLQLAIADDAGSSSLPRALDRCLDEGFGIAILADANGPAAWVFPYGDLLSYRLYGRFDGAPADPVPVRALDSVSDDDSVVLLSAPSEAYLPVCARKAMGAFLRATLQHPDPRVALVDDPPARRLVVNLSAEDYGGDEDKLRAALYYLSWFLPASYGLMAMPAGWSADGFTPLP